MKTFDALGRYGMAITDVIRQRPLAEISEFLSSLEANGISAVWFGESVGGESLATSGLLLARSQRLVVAPGVANIAARSPAALAAGRRILTEAYPERFLLGIGSSHPAIVEAYGGTPYQSQLQQLREYVESMASTPGGMGEGPEPIVIAALGPKMVEFAVSHGFGVHPWNITLDRTAWMRSQLGAEALLAPRQAVMLCDDPTVARQAGRDHLAKYLSFPNYWRNWLRQGFDDGDLEQGGSDRLIDEMVIWGDERTVNSRLDALWMTGVDHLAIHALALPGMSVADAAIEVAGFLHKAEDERSARESRRADST